MFTLDHNLTAPNTCGSHVKQYCDNYYAELQLQTNFTFLSGASHSGELVDHAAGLGHHAVAVTDRHSVAGIVRAHTAAKEAGIRLVVGATIVFQGIDWRLMLYPTDVASYGRLCRLLTLGKRRAPKGQCHLHPHDLYDLHHDLLAIADPPDIIDQQVIDQLHGLVRLFDDDRFSLAAHRRFGPDDADRLGRLAQLADHLRVPLVATNDVLYHHPDRRPLADVLTCIREGCTLRAAGLRLQANAERHLKSPAEMARLFADYPHAIARTVEIADRAAGFNLDQLRYQYPREVCPPGRTPTEHLADLAWQGALERYAPAETASTTSTLQTDAASPSPDRRSLCLRARARRHIPEKVYRQILHELKLIAELEYAPYFLTVHDLVLFARGRGILCQGRGAAANSAVCFCLGVTSVDPDRVDVLFERFVSKARNEPPHIDIDFEHERREEVLQYIYDKYGRERAALCAEVITYRPRSAVRDVGKALGLSLDCVDRLARNLGWWDKTSIQSEQLAALGFDPDSPTMRHLVALTRQLQGFPRHLSQHVGGFIITERPLCELVPIENAAMDDRTVIEWDKDDIDAMGMLKVDCLGLGMLTAINKCFDLMADAGLEDADRLRDMHCDTLDLAKIPPEDPAVYEMICRADTIGVFQIESRAQMSMLPRLRPRCYYDLVIEVAIVRPGPIQGDMVHPYLRRRNGEEPVAYPNDKVRRLLGKTLGVPLFQEQAMAMAIHCAGFTPEEADRLRRAIAAWKSKHNVIYAYGQRLMDGMIERGYDPDFAARCFEQIKGFSQYGFPESHAASFALIVYASAWLKRHHPAAFAGAIINSQPMGFYAPAQIVRDAKEHGVTILPIDVSFSQWDCCLEQCHLSYDNNASTVAGTPAPSPRPSIARPSPALRLGMRLVKGLRKADARAIAEAVKRCGPFEDIESLWRASGVSVAALRRLANADAFGSMHLPRQQALWQLRKLKDDPLPLFEYAQAPRQAAEDSADAPAAASSAPNADPATPAVDSGGLPPVPPARQVVQDYATIGMSLKAHPVSFLRKRLARMDATPCGALRDAQRCPDGRPISVAGVVLVRQRPGTASGVVFMTLEDETGAANLIFRPRIFDRFRREARHGLCLLVRGKVERQGRVVHVMVRHVVDLTPEMRGLADGSRNFR